MVYKFKNLKTAISLLILCCTAAVPFNPAFSAADDGGSSVSRTAPVIPFGSRFSLEPIRDAGPGTVSALQGIFTERVSELYENGQPWNEEKAERNATRVGPRAQAWEEGDNTALPWTFVKAEDVAIGVILAAFNKNKERPNQVEIAAAFKEEYWGQDLALSASLVYAGIYVRPLLDECEGVYATVHPDNQKSIRAMQKTGFVCENDDAYYPSGAPQEGEPQDIFYRLNMFMPAQILRAHIAVADAQREYKESCVSLARQTDDTAFTQAHFGGIPDEAEEFGSVVCEARELSLAKAEGIASSAHQRLQEAKAELGCLITEQNAE